MKDESGATAIEYGLIVALIAVVIISAVTTLAVSFPGTFTSIVKRDRRSTKVAMCVLWEPVIRSPSQ